MRTKVDRSQDLKLLMAEVDTLTVLIKKKRADKMLAANHSPCSITAMPDGMNNSLPPLKFSEYEPINPPARSITRLSNPCASPISAKQGLFFKSPLNSPQKSKNAHGPYSPIGPAH